MAVSGAVSPGIHRSRAEFTDADVTDAEASGLVPREVRTSNEVHLPCTPASVASARRALSDELTAAGVVDNAIRDAALVVSELVSNAILHAYPLPGDRLKVAWKISGSWLEVSVSDGGSATMPHDTHPNVGSVSGRGLAIVAHICQTWGIKTNEIGLTVWAILPAPAQDGRAAQCPPERTAWQAAPSAAAQKA